MESQKCTRKRDMFFLCFQSFFSNKSYFILERLHYNIFMYVKHLVLYFVSFDFFFFINSKKFNKFFDWKIFHNSWIHWIYDSSLFQIQFKFESKVSFLLYFVLIQINSSFDAIYYLLKIWKEKYLKIKS
jgi:hypothetical protein